MRLRSTRLGAIARAARRAIAVPAFNPLVVFGADLITYYGNTVDELFAQHSKAWTDSPERVTNGGFDTNLSGWTVDSGASATWVNGSMQFTTQATTMRQTISGLSAGSVVRISWKQTILGGTRARVRVRNLAANADLLFSYYTGTQIATVSVVLTDGGLNLNFLSEVADTFQIDDVSVKVLDLAKLRLYQDDAGNTPVTAVEQVIGMVMDHSIDGEWVPLTGNITWTKNSGDGVVTQSADGRTVTITGATTNTRVDRTTPNPPFQAGRLRMRVRATFASGTASFWCRGSPSTNMVTGVPLQQTVSLSNSSLDAVQLSAGTATFEILDISYWRGNPLFQSTATARMRLSRRFNLLSETDNLAASTWTRTRVALPIIASGAWKIVATNEAGIHRITRNATPLSRSVFTVEAKAAELSIIGVGEAAQTGAWVTVNLLDGQLVFSNSNRAKVTALDDGWWRISVKCFDGDLAAAGSFGVAPMPNTSTPSDNPHTFSWAGDGASGVLVRNPQVTRSAIPANNFSSSSFVAPTYQRVTSDTDYDELVFPAVLRGDGADDFYTTNQLPLAGVNALSVLGAYSRVSSGRNDALWSTNPLASGFAAIVSASDNDRFRVDLLDSTKKVVAAVPGGTNFLATAVLDTTQASPSDEIIGRVNGVAGSISITGAGVSTAMASAPLEVGRWAGTTFLLGDIFALPMLVKRVMTPDELASAEEAFSKSIGALP